MAMSMYQRSTNEGAWDRRGWGALNSSPHRQVDGPLGDELQHDRNAVSRLVDTAAQRRHDGRRLGDSFAMASQGARQLRIVAADVRRSKPFGGGAHEIQIAGHTEVVEHDAEYGQPFAHR